MPEDNARQRAQNVLASYTAEQTARFFGGGELGKPQWADPETQRKQDLQQQRLLEALGVSVNLFRDALKEFSPQTRDRLQELWEHTQRGDPRARGLFVTMYTELMAQALLR